MNRFARAVMSLDRIGELFRCVSNVKEFPEAMSGFIGIRKLNYPRQFHHRSGSSLAVYDFEDLTTLWAVWCAAEYKIPATARCIIDAGANIGAFSLFALANAPNAKIIAIEPFPTTFEKLLRLVQYNKLNSRVICMQAALTAEPTMLFMDENPDIKSHSRTALIAPDLKDHIAVRGQTLDEILEANNESEIDYLKIDIEGGEVPLFAGIDTTSLRKASKIAVECHSHAGQKVVWSKLETAGFKLDRLSRGARFSEASTAEFIRV